MTGDAVPQERQAAASRAVSCWSRPYSDNKLRILLHLRHLPPPGPSTSARVEAVPISPNKGAAQLPDAMASHAVHGVLQ